jgi:hypothetical protein
MARLSAILPDGDGLSALDDDIIRNPKALRVCIAVFDCPRWTHNAENDTDVPVMRVRRIEVIADKSDADRLLMLLRREYERRTGQTVLPLDLEDELRKALDDAEETDIP